jgi:DNA-binding transcriptional MerR regulator
MVGRVGLTVGEVEAASGVPVTTLHYYDRIGLIVPDRATNGQRRYSEDVPDPRRAHTLRRLPARARRA